MKPASVEFKITLWAILLLCIGGIAFANYAKDSVFFIFLIIPFTLQALASIALMGDWIYLRKKLLEFMVIFFQWISGTIGLLAIFDALMRTTRKTTWMVDSKMFLIFDGVSAVLFVMWILAAHDVEGAKR